ncbi:MAG: hypothetical protein ACI9R3_003636 [Verrucomicrobiales bacterium]|jgi:hypothetical protein
MSERDPLGRESYNELMNEWADTRNAMLRMQGGILHPPAYLSPVARLFGYLWRIVLVLVVLTVAAFLFLKSHIKSADFSDLIGAKMGRILEANEVEISPLRWKRSIAGSKLVTLKGSDTSFFLNELRADGFRFKLPFGSLLKSEWAIEDVFVGELTAEIRPGGGGTGLAIVEDQSGKWGVNPDKINFEGIDVASANLTWGLIGAARGSLKNAQLEVSKVEGVWQMTVIKGLLSQNYLRNLNLTNLKVRFLEGNLVFSDGEFTIGDGGTGTLDGTISIGEYPEFDLTVRFNNCEMSALLPKYTGAEITRMTPEEESTVMAVDSLREMLMGRVTGAVKLTGSSNSSAGIKTIGNLAFSEANEQAVRIHKISLFEDLGGVTGNGYLRRPQVSEGVMTFVTSEGMFTASAIDLKLGQSARLMGGFSYGIEKTQKRNTADAPAAVPGVPILEQAPDVPVPKFDGVVQFGVIPSALSAISKATQAELFPTSRDGMIWMDLPLQGNLKEVTAMKGRQLIQAVKATPRAE